MTTELGKQGRSTGSLDLGPVIDDGPRRWHELDGHTRRHRTRAVGVDHIHGPAVEAHGTWHERVSKVERDVHE
jgi:hypothetical protein